MMGAVRLFVALALMAAYCPSSYAEVSAVFFVDAAPWLDNSWPNLEATMISFLTGDFRSRFSSQSYAFLASSVNTQTTGVAYFTSQSSASASQDFGAVRSAMTQSSFNNNRWVPFGFNYLTSFGSDYDSSNLVLISDFDWSSGQYDQIEAAIEQYFQQIEASGQGRVFALQLNGGNSLRSSALQLATRFNGFASFYASVGALSASQLSDDYNTFLTDGSGGGGGGGGDDPTTTTQRTLPPGQTPPPDINTPELVNTGCLRYADVVFVVDASSSILDAAVGFITYWDLQLDFIKRIVDRVQVGTELVRVGLIVFARTIKEEQQLRMTSDVENLKRAIDSMTFLKGTTETGQALQAARFMFQNNPRNDVRKVIILITDGNPNAASSVSWETQSQIAKDKEYITIATVGIGTNQFINLDILRQIASSLGLVQQIRGFDQISNMVPAVYRNAFCDVKYCNLLDYADILFIFPTNDQELLDSAKEFAEDVIYTIRLDQFNSNVNSVGSRVAIMTMGSSPLLLGTLGANINNVNGVTTREALISLIKGITVTGFTSNYNAALSLAYSSVFIPTGDRPNARNLVVLFADTFTGSDPVAAANLLKDDKEVTIMPIQNNRDGSENLEIKRIMESIQSFEPIDGGLELYRYNDKRFNNYELATYANSFMNAACGVMEYTLVPGLEGVKGEIGDPGDRGEKGSQGLQGPEGDEGPRGANGVAGNPGSPGVNGAKGDPGDSAGIGQKGDMGDPGQPGQKGTRGDNGSNGLPGTPGLQGPQGDKGFAGAQGFKGQKGVGTPGLPGEKGNRGFDGSPGFDGPQGFKGLQGNQGAKGESGAGGLKGFEGSPGFPGSPGRTGDKGTIGLPGSPGIGIKGQSGDKGFIGRPGSPGTPGRAGSKGVNGDVGDPGSDGIPGRKGAQGRAGVDGLNGSPGSDGLKGNQGLPGFGQPGDKGIKGDAGLRGSQGFPGNPGIPGLPGTPGQVGDKGSRGNPGSQGRDGNRGNVGIKGLAGSKGLPGDRGVGQAGDRGTPGTPGSNGLPGFPGISGLIA